MMHMMDNGMGDAETSDVLYIQSQGTGGITQKKSFLQSVPPWLPTSVGDLAPTNVTGGHANHVM